MATTIPSVGYMPTSFPRDPVDVNQLEEHTFLGQILEPLVISDGNGELQPGVANAWKVSVDQLSIEFQIDPEAKFSNGKKIRAEDVEYSLSRHLTGKSQSSRFLHSIEKILVLSGDRIQVRLREPDVSVLKALSRDHLGILPAGWQFNEENGEPIIGSGLYRLVRHNGQWELNVNSHHKKYLAAVSKWRVISFADSQRNLPNLVPDIVLLMPRNILEKWEKLDKGKQKWEIQERLSFAQTSFWLHPNGKNFRDQKKRVEIAARFSMAVAEYCEQSQNERATGVVPKGVLGSLFSQVAFDHKPMFKEEFKITVAHHIGPFDDFFSKDRLEKIRSKYKLWIQPVGITPLEFSKIAEVTPDIVTGSWGGGFNDPIGFIPLVTEIVQIPLDEYLHSVWPLFKTAKQTGDWTERGKLFQQLGTQLIKEALLVPGWKNRLYHGYKENFTYKSGDASYTPRVSLYAIKEISN